MIKAEVGLISHAEHQLVGRIPIRNLWLLMLYASGLFREMEYAKVDVEDNPDDIPDLIAEILCRVVERRLRRNMTFGFRSERANLSRIRGHVDMLKTERHQLLFKGKVACQFDILTVNTPRNRYVRSALERLGTIVTRPVLRKECRRLARSLKEAGVVGEKPGRHELGLDGIGTRDRSEMQMLEAARLAFDLLLPTESPGSKHIAIHRRDEVWLRQLFEKAIGGFYTVTLSRIEWNVVKGHIFKWPIHTKTPGVDRILPSMRSDIILESRARKRQIVIDTKFTSIVKPGWYRNESLASDYVYQIYAYLRTQEDTSNMARNASGMLLHPSVGEQVDEAIVLQGHLIRFATVDLGGSSREIRTRLLQLILEGE